MPVITDSEIGVKRTRVGPNSLIGSPVKSVAIVMTRGSRRISSATASSSACWKVSSRIHVHQEIAGIGERARLGERLRRVQLGVHALAQRLDLRDGEDVALLHLVLE